MKWAINHDLPNIPYCISQEWTVTTSTINPASYFGVTVANGMIGHRIIATAHESEGRGNGH